MDQQRSSLLLAYLAIFVMTSVLVHAVLAPQAVPTPYSRFRQLLNDGQVVNASIGPSSIRFSVRPEAPLTEDEERASARQDTSLARSPDERADTRLETTRLPGMSDDALLSELVAKGVVVSGRIESTFWRDLLLTGLLPVALLLLIWGVVARRMGGGLGSTLTLGKNRARIYSEQAINVRGRVQILEVHLRKIRTGSDIDAKKLAARTPGFSGADLANLVNEGALLAARRNKERVEQADFEEAADRLTPGIERRSRVLSEIERDIVAHHEAGHALVAALVPHADPVHKVTIIPRAMGTVAN